MKNEDPNQKKKILSVNNKTSNASIQHKHTIVCFQLWGHPAVCTKSNLYNNLTRSSNLIDKISTWLKWHYQISIKEKKSPYKDKLHVTIYLQIFHHLFILGPGVDLEHPTAPWSTDFPLNCCEEYEPLFLNFPGNSLLGLPFNVRFFLMRFRLSKNIVLRGGACKAPSTQSPTCTQSQGLDGPSSQNGLSLGKPLLSLEKPRRSGELSSPNLTHRGQGGSFLRVFGVVCSKHSAWKTWRQERTPATGISPLFTILRELQGDLCERNFSHKPHLKPLEGLHGWLKISGSSDSETSAKSMLLLALLQRWASLCGVAVSNSENPAVESGASLVYVWVEKDKGCIGFDMKERRLEKFRWEDKRDLNVGSDSLLSEWEDVEPPLSGISEVPCTHSIPLWNGIIADIK